MKNVVLTGDRPTGVLHLGHLKGSLEMRVDLQNQYPHSSYILIADQQALTDNFEHPEKVRENLLKVYACYLAVGIDPNLTTIFVQSLVPELFEITAHLTNLVTNNQLMRNPTLKAEAESKGYDNLPTGFFMYPISQIADVIGVKGTLVPVGEDQLPHLEFANDICKKFNRTYKTDILQSCQPILSRTTRLVGLDGKEKMSKSLGNAIFLNDSPELIKKKVFKMFTDPNHLTVDSPGNPNNPVFDYLRTFHEDADFMVGLQEHYARGGLGDVKCKQILDEVLQAKLAPIREKYNMYISDEAELMRQVKASSGKTRQVVQGVVTEIRSAIGINY